MKVLQATTAYGWSGGTEQCLLLAKYMNKLGVKADILCFKGTELERRARKLGIEVRYFPNTRKFSISEAKKLAEIVADYDLVNTHISKAQWFVWLATLLAAKKPRLVYTRRVLFDISPFSAVTKYNFFVDAIIGISEAICLKLRKFPFLRNKVYLIPSGVELDRFSPDINSNLREEIGINKNAIVFTSVANFSRVKGHYVLIPAFKKLVEVYSDREIFLLLVGRDTTSDEAKQLIDKYGLRGKVFPLGFRRDVPEILKETDIFVFPSIEEGLGSSLLQAMAMEKLVVASDAGGIRNYLVPDVNGIMVRKGDVDSLYKGLVKALNVLETSEAKRLRKEARKTAQNFDIKQVTEKTLKLYEEILNG